MSCEPLGSEIFQDLGSVFDYFIPFFLFFRFNFYMYGCFALFCIYMNIYALFSYIYMNEGTRFPGSCEPTCGCWELKTVVLEKNKFS